MAKRKPNRPASSAASRRHKQLDPSLPYGWQSDDSVACPQQLRKGADTLRGPISACDNMRLTKIKDYEERTRRILTLLVDDSHRVFTATEISRVTGVPRNQVGLLLFGYKVDHRRRGKKVFGVFPPPGSQPTSYKIVEHPV